MDFKEMLEKSWALFVAHLPALVLSTLVFFACSFLSLGFMAPVLLAGYTQSVLLLVREGRAPEIRDLFSFLRLFFPLLALAILSGLLVFLGLVVLVLPGILVGLALSFFLPYVLPLMTDQELGLVEAVRESIHMALRQPVSEQVAVVALYLVITSVGSSTGLGALLTQPFATILLMLAYEFRRIPVSEHGKPPRIPA